MGENRNKCRVWFSWVIYLTIHVIYFSVLKWGSVLTHTRTHRKNISPHSGNHPPHTHTYICFPFSLSFFTCHTGLHTNYLNKLNDKCQYIGGDTKKDAISKKIAEVRSTI